jgi:arginyl-tRNA synthetase
MQYNTPLMNELKKLLKACIDTLYGLKIDITLSRPDEQFGDYATNIALQISKQLGKNPRDIAAEIVQQLQGRDELADVSVAGPGFINLRLSDQALVQQLDANHINESSKTVLVEYSDPNPFKPLHAGHLYTTLVGDSIARLIERADKVIRLNYGGDVGLHAAKSMWSIIRALGGENPEKLDEVPTDARADWLGQRYVEGNSAHEDDDNAKQEITQVNKKIYALHNENDQQSPFAQIYWTTRQWSYDYFKHLYEELDVKPFDRFIPESEVATIGIQTVESNTGDVYKKSDGAIVFHGEEHGLHTRVFINSEGLPTYETKEVGLMQTKWQDYNFDESIIITANEQEQYMQVVLKSIEQFNPEPVRRTRHLNHGVVKLTGGVKMSSRKGNTVLAMDIIEAARQAATASGMNSSEENILAAIKYAFLKHRIGGDIIYDPNESVALEGNSGPYLQYAHARACSILAKAEAPIELDAALRFEPDERSLLRKITEYQEVVQRATDELMPHHICNYLYELAQSFNRFYEKNRVIDDERQSVRLYLVKQYTSMLSSGLGLLGIHAPERM